MNNVINLEEYNKLLKLQKDYENNMVNEDVLTLDEVNELIRLYKIQIKVLESNIKRKLIYKKTGDNI
ncbi:MAG: hypothetical protein E7172_05150 [Firmicutes bacterium]|nr:hypothetical protein [Bacillota bacterium]